jgi:lysozyme
MDLLKSIEKYSARSYKDAAGKSTIGYGHKITRGDGVAPGEVINEFKAVELLERDVKKAVDIVSTSVLNNNISQNQFDALVMLAYSMDTVAFLSSSLLRYVNEGDFEAAYKEFPKLCKVHTSQGAFVELAGLKDKRLAQQSLFDEPEEALSGQ